LAVTLGRRLGGETGRDEAAQIVLREVRLVDETLGVGVGVGPEVWDLLVQSASLSTDAWTGR